MLNLDTSAANIEQRKAMSLMEPRLSDLRAGFGGYGLTPSVGSLPTSPVLPLWRPHTGAAPMSWCTIPSCPCAMSISNISRSYLSLADLYDYPGYSSYSWSSWYLKAAQDSLYKGLPPPPPLPPSSLERPPLHPHPPMSPDDARSGDRESIDPRSSPGKELPSKMSKHERIKVWLEVSKPPKYEKEPLLHSHQPNGSSQMSVRSSSPSELSDRYNMKGEPATPSDTYSSLHHPSYLSSHAQLRTPPPHPPPRYPHPPPHPVAELHSPSDGPLNLSISNNSTSNGDRDSGPHSPSQCRPSVITCATLPYHRRYEEGSSGSASPSRKDTDICDPAIEEHFRRSLGKNYPDFFARQHSTSTPSPPPPAPLPQTTHVIPPHMVPPHIVPPHLLPHQEMAPSPASSAMSSPSGSSSVNKNVSVSGATGSVDDHFARALGNSTWSALKAKNDPADAVVPGSVDDHFAKALGDTWLKLKDKEPSSPLARTPGAPGVPSSPLDRVSPHGFPLSHSAPHVPHSLTHPVTHPAVHPLPRAHSLPHPLAQRPSSSSPPSHTGSLVST